MTPRPRIAFVDIVSYPTSYGYDKLALPGLTVLERVRLTVAVTRMTALPDGHRLIVWSDPGSSTDQIETDRVTLVDVGAALPAPPKQVLPLARGPLRLTTRRFPS